MLRVASGGWRVASGGWRVAGGEWRVAGGEWRVASGAVPFGLIPTRPKKRYNIYYGT